MVAVGSGVRVGDGSRPEGRQEARRRKRKQETVIRCREAAGSGKRGFRIEIILLTNRKYVLYYYHNLITLLEKKENCHVTHTIVL
jgi:hypothetical protein